MLTNEQVGIIFSTFPEVARAIARLKRGDTRGPDWEFMHFNASDRNLFDDWLVRFKHPLAFEPGTQEQRFKAIVKEIHEREMAK